MSIKNSACKKQTEFFTLNYTIARMESTGFFLAALYTGKNVATTAVTSATPTRISIDIGPNTNRDTPDSAEPISVLMIEQATKQPTMDMTIEMSAIKKDSEKKILNTSELLAPTARKIPISRFLCEIDTEIKLERSKAANTAITIPIHMNTVLNSVIIPLTISKASPTACEME